MNRKLARASILALAGLLATIAVGCPCSGIVNKSPWLQWQLFAMFGAEKVCQEMTKTGALMNVPVPVPGFPNAIGRFFPDNCQSNLNHEAKTISVWISGNGYAWTPATSKMAFELRVSMEYKPSFHMDDGTTYAWFEPASSPPAPQFRITHVEQPATNAALRLYPVEWFAASLGRSFATAQLAKGFTVIEEDNKRDFALGRLAVGQRPVHPWTIEDDERYTFVNEDTEIRGLQQDFLGPFEVADDDQALYVKLQVKGPALDVFVLTRDAGRTWRLAYQGRSPPPSPPPGAPIIQQGQTAQGGFFEGWVPVRRGSYYIVLDNSASAGTVRPPPKIPTPVDPSVAQAASVSYLVQLGDRP